MGVEASAEHRQKSQGWCRNKSRQLADLEAKVKRHQHIGTANVEKMLQTLEEKTLLVEKMRADRNAEDKAVIDAREHGSKRVDDVRMKLMEKRAKKDEAREELD